MTMHTKFTAIAEAINQRLSTVFESALDAGNRGLFFEIPSLEISEEVKSLTLRGGKRLRPAMMVAGFELFEDNALENEALIDTACALELLQSYFLIHDDIIDDDTMRRGKASVHAALQKSTNNDTLGIHLGILAGDLASALQHWLLSGLNCPPDRALQVHRIFSRMHMDVVFGQTLDVLGNAPPEDIVKRKTASYTTIGPLCCGAVLGGATEEQTRQMALIARPIGIAFQYRDDMIGVFGDPETTGKPVGSDLRNNKRTQLVEDAIFHLDERDSRQLKSLLEKENSSETEIETALGLIVKSGARERCEHNIGALCEQSQNILKAMPLRHSGKSFLVWLQNLLAHRVV